ncbi:MAG: hypothetical protein H7235_01625, partial [Bdellovibrionaceae bacterium]|nr:hypothetical protein [Pseudobdellovibrionaceae bacterium]
MQFNALVWSSYLESSKGQAWIKFFSNLKQSHDRKDDELKKLIMHWGAHTNFADNRIDVNEEIQLVSNAIKDLLRAVDQGHIPDKVLNHIESINYFNKVSELKSEDESEELFYVDDISRLSVALYCLHPKYFFPYYFYPNFYALEKIFNEFGIFLPPVPSKSDYDSRFFYYLELCKSLSDYWEKLGFLTEHLPVFLYGFAGEVIDLKTTSEVSLPKPRRAWFVGGGTTNGDSNYLDNAKDKSMTFWTCNKDTEVGDIIVIYVLAPRSEIHSIWRAVRPAVIEPFRSYYSTVWMGHCQRLKFPLKIS